MNGEVERRFDNGWRTCRKDTRGAAEPVIERWSIIYGGPRTGPRPVETMTSIQQPMGSKPARRFPIVAITICILAGLMLAPATGWLARLEAYNAIFPAESEDQVMIGQDGIHGFDRVPPSVATHDIEVGFLRAPRPLDVLRLAFRFVIGAPHEDASFNVYSARRVRIRTGRPQPLQLDGDPMGSVTRVNMEVVAGAALIVTPAPPGTEVPG